MVNGSPRRRCENSRTASESARYQASDSTQAIRHLCRGGRQSPFSQRDVALPTEGRGARVVGRVGAELTAEAGREAARVAALNVLASQVFGVTRYGDTDCEARCVGRDLGGCARSAESCRCRFGAVGGHLWKRQNPCRLVYGVPSLPLGTPVVLELIFEVTG